MKTRLNEKYLLTMPKNKQSVRNVPIPDKLAELIRFHLDYLKWQKGFSKAWFLCGGPKPILDTTADKMKEDAKKRDGIPPIRVHDLRHSYASLLINGYRHRSHLETYGTRIARDYLQDILPFLSRNQL